MDYQVDDELYAICEEIEREDKSEEEWAASESSDWFQTLRYNGGFDANDMHFAFTVYTNSEKQCFAITLQEALAISRRQINIIKFMPSPW